VSPEFTLWLPPEKAAVEKRRPDVPLRVLLEERNKPLIVAVAVILKSQVVVFVTA
jgi:hypothetical protein